MRLTMLSDYALRVLMFAAAHRDRLVTINETLKTYEVSRGHLMKVVTVLGQEGFLRSQRGRSGGFSLARAPEEIVLGDVLRVTEPDYRMVECFTPGHGCSISACCRLPGVVNEALSAFLGVFDRYTLAELMLRPEDFEGLVDAPRPFRGPVGAYDPAP